MVIEASDIEVEEEKEDCLVQLQVHISGCEAVRACVWQLATTDNCTHTCIHPYSQAR